MNIFTLFSAGYRVSSALTVEIAQESEKAIKFVVVDNKKCSFWIPKKAVTKNKDVDGVFNLAGWFTKDAFLKNMFDIYGSHYNR